MTGHKLTRCAQLATSGPMNAQATGAGRRHAGRQIAGLALATLALSGCITVNAPEDAIVIELNVNIRQEVIYRLAEDAGNTIDENADIF